MFDEIKTRELSFRELFNTGFRIYTANFRVLAMLAVIICAPVLLLIWLTIYPSFQELFMLLGLENIFDYMWHGDAEIVADMQSQMILALNPANMPIELVESIDRISYIILAALVVISAVFLPLLSSGSAYLINESIEGRKGSFDGMMSSVLVNIVKTSLTTMLAFACVFIGLFTFILPGIYMAVCFAFVVPAVITTGKWGFGALRESFIMVKRNWFKTLGFIVSLFIFGSVFSQFFLSLTTLVNLFWGQGLIALVIFSFAGFVILSYFFLVKSLSFINKYHVMKIKTE